MTAAAVELTDVFRVYSTPEGDAAALQGLSLRVRAGEVVVVLGPSGSGKTTLLQLLAGLDRPSAGSVRVFGRELSKLAARHLAAYRSANVGFVDQHYTRALAPELSAQELVELRLGLTGEPRRSRSARAEELLTRVGLADKADRHPTELSGGEQQRVAVAAALAHRPLLLLADEPTGEVDAATAEQIFELIGSVSRELGCTTIVVSHDASSARIADRAVAIRDGRVSEEAAARGGEDAIVVGRGGWLRLPEELLARAGIREHATARLGEQGVVVSAIDGERPRETPAPSPTTSVRERDAGEVASVRSLAKVYRTRGVETRVFEHLDLSFTGGRLHALTGPSGSGKTTVLHLLAGLELPSAGAVTVLGTELNALGREERAAFRRRHIALVAQESGLIPFLSARENVELAVELRAQNGVAPDAVLDRLGLGDRASQRVARLSAGEQTRVDVARALATRPQLLLADEPTARLDQANALAVANLLVRLARDTGAAIVCATHDPIMIEHADVELKLGA